MDAFKTINHVVTLPGIGRSACFKEPDGNTIALFQPSSRASARPHRTAIRGRGRREPTRRQTGSISRVSPRSLPSPALASAWPDCRRRRRLAVPPPAHPPVPGRGL